MIKKNITINARKFDGRIHRSWKADLIEKKDSLLVFLGVFENEVNHPDLGVIRPNTTSYEYYWLNRWYNIFRFHEPNGELRNYYCNINMPPRMNKKVLDYIDLDIDILVWNDFSYKILDEKEYEENAKKFNYQESLKYKVKENIEVLIKKIEAKKFPFSV